MLIKESMQKERQISIDPISVNESGSPSSPLPPLVPTRYKFISNSLPSSAPSSPRISSAFMKRKERNQNQVSSPLSGNSLARQHSVALTRLAQLREKHLQRSKSCGEGRASAPPDDFDLWLTNVNGSDHNPRQVTPSWQAQNKSVTTKSQDEEFKCGALCIFLAGFGKGKPVRSRKDGPDSPEMSHVISRSVSLEKFECGSWTSSAINDGDGEGSKLYFDLPLELIRTSVNDASSPVNSAFVFDKDVKGVLKKGSRGGKSGESSRHVRFSTSSPTGTAYPTSPSSTCVTPRLRKAREEFNAFIEAQSA